MGVIQWLKKKKNKMFLVLKKKRKAKYTVTQLQRYNGNNPFNNDVCVDYVRRRVTFDPVTFTSLTQLWRTVVSRIFIISFMVCAGLIIVPFVLLAPEIARFAVYVSVFVSGLNAIIYTFLFKKSKLFISDVYPRLNELLIIVYSAMMLSRNPKKRFTVNRDGIIDRRLIIPFFDNVVIEWEVTAGFSRNLYKVVVQHVFEEDAYRFFAVFKFKRKPSTGYMTIKYI